MLHVETTRAERWLPDRAVYLPLIAIDIKQLRYAGLGRPTRAVQAGGTLKLQ